MKDIIAEITFQARAAPEVSQVSGVSVRMSINNLESLISNAEKRAIRNREPEIVPAHLRPGRRSSPRPTASWSWSTAVRRRPRSR